MPSLAGRPPFATDLPDSAYEQPARPRPAPAPKQGERPSSTYDVYDNYLDAKNPNPGQNRTSGVGAAFMNGMMDDDESESEDDHSKMTRKPMDPHHSPVSMPVPQTGTGKNAALAAAVRPRDDDEDDPNPPPQYRAHAQTPQPPPQATIAAPRPGYAAPINALNNAADSNRQVPPGIQIPHPNQPIPHTSPSPTSPHPLQAPLTPIQPAFARPRPPKEESGVKFTGDIVRGDKEGEMLPRRGEKGDDFWRRFSMVVKDEGSKREKTSTWLRKTQGGQKGFSKWIWVIGFIFVVAAAGGIGLGWYMSHKGPDSYKVTAVGGSEGETAAGTTSAARTVGTKGATVLSSLHVTPTNTVDRREPTPQPTPIAFAAREAPAQLKKRFMHNRSH